MKNRLRAARRTRVEPSGTGRASRRPRQSVNAIETGKYDPSLPLAFKIARLFGQSIEAIFEDR